MIQSTSNGGRSSLKKNSKFSFDMDLDTPYTRKSIANLQSTDQKVVALRIEQFLKSIGVFQVNIDDEINKFITPLKEKDLVGSLKSEDTKNSKVSFGKIAENKLYQMRKTSCLVSELSFQSNAL